MGWKLQAVVRELSARCLGLFPVLMKGTMTLQLGAAVAAGIGITVLDLL